MLKLFAFSEGFEAFRIRFPKVLKLFYPVQVTVQLYLYTVFVPRSYYIDNITKLFQPFVEFCLHLLNKFELQFQFSNSRQTLTELKQVSYIVNVFWRELILK